MTSKNPKPRRIRAVVNVGYYADGDTYVNRKPGEDCSDAPNAQWLLDKGYAVEGLPAPVSIPVEADEEVSE